MVRRLWAVVGLAVPAQSAFLGQPGVVADAAAGSDPSSIVRQAVAHMWQGLDKPDQRITSVPGTVVDQNLPALQSVQILGLQNSGAYLLETMLYKNFGNQLNYYSDGPEDPASCHKTGFWPHSNIREKWRLERDVFKPLEDNNVYTIAMIRSPLSWLQAMRTFPQGFEDCVAGEDWVSSPCSHSMPGGSGSVVPSTTYANLASMWNAFNTGYHAAAEYGFKNRVVIPYESLLRHPEGVMDHIAAFLGMPKPAEGWAVPADMSAADTGSRAGALKYVFRKLYLDAFSPQDKGKVCSHLDRDLQSKYGYDDCSTALHIFTSIDGAETMPENV